MAPLKARKKNCVRIEMGGLVEREFDEQFRKKNVKIFNKVTVQKAQNGMAGDITRRMDDL